MFSAHDLFVRIKDDNILALGSQLAYSFLFAFFPFLIFIITILGFSSIKSEDVLLGLQNVFPLEVYKLVAKTVREVFDNRNVNLLSFGIIATIFTASNGIMAVISALNKAYDEEETRGFIKVELIAIACTLGIAFIIAIAFILQIFGEVNNNILFKYIGLNLFFQGAGNIIRYVMMFFIMMFIFAALYHYTPCRRLGWKEVFPGAVFTTIGWGVCSELFSFYINNFGNYSKVYGSIGAVIIFMTWLFLISEILLLGGEINATFSLSKLVIDKNKR